MKIIDVILSTSFNKAQIIALKTFMKIPMMKISLHVGSVVDPTDKQLRKGGVDQFMIYLRDNFKNKGISKYDTIQIIEEELSKSNISFDGLPSLVYDCWKEE